MAWLDAATVNPTALVVQPEGVTPTCQTQLLRNYAVWRDASRAIGRHRLGLLALSRRLTGPWSDPRLLDHQGEDLGGSSSMLGFELNGADVTQRTV